jgi:hypothetical protein
MSGSSTFGSKSTTTFQNVNCLGGLHASHATLMGDLRVNAAHRSVSNIIMGRQSIASGTFVGGGASTNTAPYDPIDLTGVTMEVGVAYEIEVQDGGEIFVASVPNPSTTYSLPALSLTVAGMHSWAIAPSGSGTMQFDGTKRKMVFAQTSSMGYNESGSAGNGLRANGRIALEAGAMISNVQPDLTDVTTNTVPQFVLQSGAEKWRIALVTDSTDGIMKLVVQRYVGIGTGPDPTIPWETVGNFEGSSMAAGTTAANAPLSFTFES